MVVCSTEHSLQADIIFVIEATAVNGAYINDLRTNYIIPSLEYFSQGNIDESSYLAEGVSCFYGIVTYQAADCLPHPSSDTIGPFTSPTKVLTALDKLELIGGKGESNANIAEGLATTLNCFEELQQKRDGNVNVQRHCVLVCNSPPYSLPVFENHSYSGKTAEQLAGILQEKNINLSIISPRKIPTLYKLFEKAGGDLGASQTKNYAKDPRHLVLLRGYSLKERPISPPPGPVSSTQNQIPNTPLPMTSLPSPLAGNDSPISGSGGNNPNMLGASSAAPPVGVMGQSPVYRPPGPPQMVGQGMAMVNANRGMIPLQSLPAPPVYHPTNRPPNRWPMPPPQPQRPYMQTSQQVNPTQGSALIAQLTQPPSSLSAGGPVNQFGQIGTNSPLSAQQQQQLKMNMLASQQGQQQPNVPQNQPGPMAQVSQPNPNQVVASPAQTSGQAAQQQLGSGRERHSIWQGLLEWIEKPKNPTDQQKITKHVPCQVSANSKDGEPELKADGWPAKLIMQLMPKQLIGNIGGAYLKNSKSVLFHPKACEALESLTKVMSSGFAGCVHFTSVPNPTACDIKVLILLYTAEKQAYLGFIPNDQVAFVDRLRKVIQQQKSTQIMRQTQGMVPNMGAQQPQQQQPQQQQQQQQQPGPNQGMMGAPVQRAPFENQLQVERQQNLEKINQLRQTLEAAQQQEQQYKSQLERISHMKTSQLQEALQLCQQQEMQYKMLDQQRISGQGNPQGPNPQQQQQQQQQQRMMRPVMGGNPGLRHLLQQQPQYRQQLQMGMQQMGGNGPRPQMSQQIPNAGNNQQGGFDEVPYEFM